MPSKPQPKKLWTFMVYMAGDNNLDPNGARDLIEMKRVGSTDQVNVVAQFDRSRDRGSKRYYLQKGGVARSDVVAEQGKFNAGDPKNLLDFIKWATKQYPAERNILVLWNHGQGWDDTDVYADERNRSLRRFAKGSLRRALFRPAARKLLKAAITQPTARAILLDDGAKDFLDSQEMKQVLASAAKLLKKNLDVLGMDACLMSMAEVGYQVRGSVDFTVGSEETEPVEGWPYHTILAALAQKPTMTARELVGLIPAKYVASYRADSQITQSSFDLAKTEALAAAVAALVERLIPGLDDGMVLQQLLIARTRVQIFDVGDNIDLLDWCGLVGKALPNTPIGAACRTAGDTARKVVVAAAAKGEDLGNAHGVAIYYPTEAVSPLYQHLDFARRTGWGRFLELYLTAVRAR